MTKLRNKTIKPGALTELITDYIEVVDDRLTLSDIRMPGAEFYVDYLVDKNDNWYNALRDTMIETDGGTLVPSEGASFVADSLKYNLYNVIDSQKITLQTTIKSTAGGSPSVDVPIISLSADIDESVLGEMLKDIITLEHLDTGYLYAKITEDGNAIIAEAEVPFNPSADTEYNIAVCYDNTVSVGQQVISIFIDGIKQTITSPRTGLKLIAASAHPIQNVLIGAYESSVPTKDITMKYLTINSDILYSDSFIFVEQQPITKYSLDEQIAVVNDVVVSMENLTNILGFTSNGNVKFTFLVNDGDLWIERYWDSVTLRWETASGTMATSNVFADMDSTKLYHLFHKPAKVKLKIYMISTDGFDDVFFDNSVVEYLFYFLDIPKVHYTLVYGLISGSLERRSDFRVTAILDKPTVYGGTINMYPEVREAVTDERMYWELTIPTTDDMSDDASYTITVNKNDSLAKSIVVKVPKVDTIEFEELAANYAYGGDIL